MQSIKLRSKTDFPETKLWSQVFVPHLTLSPETLRVAGRYARPGVGGSGKAEDGTLEDYLGSFSHFSLANSRENTTFPLFSEHSCHGLGRLTKTQECCLSDHKARTSRSRNSSYSAPRGPNPSVHRALSSLAALGTADSQLLGLMSMAITETQKPGVL